MARRAWIGLLRGESADHEVERCLEVARRSGMDRLRYNAYAHGALYYAIRRQWTLATELPREFEHDPAAALHHRVVAFAERNRVPDPLTLIDPDRAD